MRAPSQLTLREASTSWLEGVRAGTIRNRSGDRYKPSVIRGYEASLRKRLLPELGGKRISAAIKRAFADCGFPEAGVWIAPEARRPAPFYRQLTMNEIASAPASGDE